MKTCSKCGGTSPFYTDSGQASGLSSACASCQREQKRLWYSKNRIVAIARRSSWYRSNREKAVMAMRKYRLENSSSLKKADREYYTKNRITILMKKHDWRVANPSLRKKATETTRRWKKNHPAESRRLSMIHSHRRRARLRRAFVEDVDIEKLIVRDGGMCGICDDHVTFGQESIDHIIPLCRGGQHSYSNTQLAHRVCNIKANRKTEMVFA